MPKHTHSISDSPPFCVGIMATMAGRTIIQRCLRRRKRMGWSEFDPLTARFRLLVPRITRTWAQARI